MPFAVKVWLKVPPSSMVPESKAATPAGKTTYSLVAAWAGSKVTLWLITTGLVQFTVSPTLQFTVAGTKSALGLFFIETSMVLPCAQAGMAVVKAGAAALTPRAAMVLLKARRCRDILFSWTIAGVKPG